MLESTIWGLECTCSVVRNVTSPALAEWVGFGLTFETASHHVPLAGLELSVDQVGSTSELHHLSASRVLGLKACAT